MNKAISSAEPFSTSRWYPINEELRRIYFEGFGSKTAAIAFKSGWNARKGDRLNQSWTDMKEAGWVLEPGREHRGGTGRGAGRKIREDGRGNEPVRIDVETHQILQAEAKRRSQISKRQGGQMVPIKDVASSLIFDLRENEWDVLLDDWQSQSGTDWTNVNVQTEALKRLDQIVEALSQEIHRRNTVVREDNEAWLKIVPSRAAVLTTIARMYLPHSLDASSTSNHGTSANS
ncbi:MAG: hypothetical protein AAFY26_06040 [Cyanobacteria bacterium J06638_22]